MGQRSIPAPILKGLRAVQSIVNSAQAGRATDVQLLTEAQSRPCLEPNGSVSGSYAVPPRLLCCLGDRSLKLPQCTCETDRLLRRRSPPPSMSPALNRASHRCHGISGSEATGHGSSGTGRHSCRTPSISGRSQPPPSNESKLSRTAGSDPLHAVVRHHGRMLR